MPVVTFLSRTTYLAPANEALSRAVASTASKAVGAALEFRVGRSYRDLADDDLAFVCGLAYVALGDGLAAVAAPVPSGARYGGRPVYFSDVVVRRDSVFRSFS